MTTYQATQPFVYIIGWSKLDVWYIGVRYKRGCQPTDIWTKYFTSSRYVAAFRVENGEPDHVEVLLTGDKQTVLAVEAEALESYKLHKDGRFLNLNIGGTKFCMSSKTWEDEVYRTKMTAHLKGRKRSDEAKAKISAAHTGKTVSAQTRAKISAARKGKNTGPRPKTGPLSLETRAKISAANKGQACIWKGKKRSEETRARMSASAKLARARRAENTTLLRII